MKVAVGDQAPGFALEDQDGEPWSLEDRRGAPVVLYFFPKADTPGCTTQACDVRDHWEAFGDLGVEVVGISPDPPRAMSRFAAKYELPQRLLGDPSRAVIDAYGAWGPKTMRGKSFEGVIRSSVVIDADGVVAAVLDNIQAKRQSELALTAVRELSAA